MRTRAGTHRRWRWTIPATTLVLLLVTSCAGARPPVPPPGAPLEISVSGNRLVDQGGRTVRLQGVNRSGSQYACTTGPSTFEGPTDAAAVDAMRSWGINAVRVSLDEHCWLGVNGLPVGRDGADYRRDVVGYVDRLTALGLVVIVDLHWSAPGGVPASAATDVADPLRPMPDRDHAPAFWRSVAATFAPNRAVLFDLFNEPFPDLEDATDPRATDEAWRCVRDGGVCARVGFLAAGMQELVDAVRSTGARNTVLVAGPQYAGVLDRWLTNRPVDPLGQLVASIHVYGPPPDQTSCSTPDCWSAQIAPVAREVPVVIGEMGDQDCSSGVVDPLMDFADAHGISYLAWAWITADCASEPSLISDYDGTPTAYGSAVRARYLGRG
jgi:endoglucanase